MNIIKIKVLQYGLSESDVGPVILVVHFVAIFLHDCQELVSDFLVVGFLGKFQFFYIFENGAKSFRQALKQLIDFFFLD